jgi:hypothetical protein
MCFEQSAHVFSAYPNFFILVGGGALMPSMEDLARAVADYRDRKISLDDFEDWFRDNSRGMFGESPDVLEACLLFEAAFSRLRFEDVSEAVFCQDLVDAVRHDRGNFSGEEASPVGHNFRHDLA